MKIDNEQNKTPDTLDISSTVGSNNFFYFLMFLAMIGWGISWINAKFLSVYINEYEMILLRNLISFVFLIPIIIMLAPTTKPAFKTTKKMANIAKNSTNKKYYIAYLYKNLRVFFISTKNITLAFIVAIVMMVYMKFYFLGVKFGTASLGGALVTSVMPIATFIFIAIIYKHKIVKKDIFALFVGAIGVLSILNIWTYSMDDVFTIYNLYFFIAALSWPFISIISKKSIDISPIVFSFYVYIIMFVLSALFFVNFSELFYKYNNTFDDIFWINMISLSIFSTVFATSIYFVGIEKLGSNSVNSFAFLVPFSAIGFGVLFLDESASLSMLGGVVLTLWAVKMLNNIKFKLKFKSKIKP